MKSLKYLAKCIQALSSFCLVHISVKGAALITVGAIVIKFATGCSTSSTPMPSGLGNNLSLSGNTPNLVIKLPTDPGKPKVAIFLGNVECNTLVTGRPLELVRNVRLSMVQDLASSGNFALVDSTHAAQFLIEVNISSFERAVKTQADAHATDIILSNSQSQETRRGIFELQLVVTDLGSDKLIHTFSVTSEADDSLSEKSNSLLGFTMVGLNYERRPDSEVVSEATGKAALKLWRMLVDSGGQFQTPNPNKI